MNEKQKIPINFPQKFHEEENSVAKRHKIKTLINISTDEIFKNNLNLCNLRA